MRLTSRPSSGSSRLRRRRSVRQAGFPERAALVRLPRETRPRPRLLARPTSLQLVLGEGRAGAVSLPHAIDPDRAVARFSRKRGELTVKFRRMEEDRSNLRFCFTSNSFGIMTEGHEDGRITVRNLEIGGEAYQRDVHIEDVISGINDRPLHYHCQDPSDVEELTKVLTTIPKPLILNVNEPESAASLRGGQTIIHAPIAGGATTRREQQHLAGYEVRGGALLDRDHLRPGEGDGSEKVREGQGRRRTAGDGGRRRGRRRETGGDGGRG